MKFSVIGDLAEALPVMLEIQQSAEHQLGPCCLSGELAHAVAASAVPVLLESSPENAFLSAGVDAVLLAVNDTEATLQLARSASQADRHLLVLAPTESSTAFGFELHLILDESSRGIVPLTGRMQLRELDAVQWRVVTVPELDIDKVRQLNILLPLFSESLDQLVRRQLDALDCLGSVGIPYSQMTALESRDTHGRLISRLLTLGASTVSGQSLPPATVTIRPADPVATESRVFAGDSDASRTEGTLSMQIVAMDGTIRQLHHDPDAAVLPRFVQICGSQECCRQAMQAFAVALEMSDAVNKSLRRKRTVDVYFDSGSERGVFKSQMTAIGCGVLTWMLLGMVAYLIFAQVTELPDMVLHVARIVWMLPLALFLLAQLLLPLTRDRSAHR